MLIDCCSNTVIFTAVTPDMLPSHRNISLCCLMVNKAWGSKGSPPMVLGKCSIKSDMSVITVSLYLWREKVRRGLGVRTVISYIHLQRQPQTHSRSSRTVCGEKSQLESCETKHLGQRVSERNAQSHLKAV